MFLRRIQRKKNGKVHTYWALAESYRTACGSRQRIVSYLGELKETEQSGWAQLSAQLYGHRRRPRRSALARGGRDPRAGPLLRTVERTVHRDDVTSTCFEGQCRSNPLAKRGYSRDKRPATRHPAKPAAGCPLQVCIALVATSDGIPVGYEVFAGNRHDSTTAEEIVQSIEKKHGRANRIWVLDRGMVSEQNLTFLRSRDGQYIVGTPKAMLRKFEQHLVDKDWKVAQDGVEVKLVRSPDGDETFILARSAERREKERDSHARFLARMEEGRTKLQASMENGRLKDEAVAHRRLGRLQGENSRAAKDFDVEIKRLEQPQGKARLQITWTRNEAWSEWARLSEGCYLLRSNLNESDPATLWKQYIQLTDAQNRRKSLFHGRSRP